jgi:hypothetical protein
MLGTLANRTHEGQSESDVRSMSPDKVIGNWYEVLSREMALYKTNVRRYDTDADVAVQ